MGKRSWGCCQLWSLKIWFLTVFFRRCCISLCNTSPISFILSTSMLHSALSQSTSSSSRPSSPLIHSPCSGQSTLKRRGSQHSTTNCSCTLSQLPVLKCLGRKTWRWSVMACLARRQQIEPRMNMLRLRGSFLGGKLTASNLWGCSSMLNTSTFTHTTIPTMNCSSDSSARMHPQFQDMQMCSISSADQKRLIAKAPRAHRLTSSSLNWLTLKVVHSLRIFSRPSCTSLRHNPCRSSLMRCRRSSQKHQLRFCFSRITGREQASPSSSQFLRCTMSRSNLSRKQLRISFLRLRASLFASPRRKNTNATALKYFFSFLALQFTFLLGCLVFLKLDFVPSYRELGCCYWLGQGCWKGQGGKKGQGLGCELRCCCLISSMSCYRCLTSSFSRRSNFQSGSFILGVLTFSSFSSPLSELSQSSTADIFLSVLWLTLSSRLKSESVSVTALLLLPLFIFSSRSMVASSSLSLLCSTCRSRYCSSLQRLSGQWKDWVGLRMALYWLGWARAGQTGWVGIRDQRRFTGVSFYLRRILVNISAVVAVACNRAAD